MKKSEFMALKPGDRLLLKKKINARRMTDDDNHPWIEARWPEPGTVVTYWRPYDAGGSLEPGCFAGDCIAYIDGSTEKVLTRRMVKAKLP